ncbi:DUF4270 family protein [Bacteroidota bacterium]
MKQFKVLSYAKVIYIILFFSAFISSCKYDETPFGTNIQPDKDKTHYRYFETSDVHLHTIKAPALNTNILSEALLGNITDSLFGSVKCDFLSEFLPNKIINTDTIASVTQVNLRLYSEGYFGIVDSQQIVFRVYLLNKQLEDSLESDIDANLYYYDRSLLIEKVVMLYESDQIYTFELPVGYWNSIFQEIDSIEKKEILKYFKGFYITSVTNDTAGCLRNILLNYSYLEINYLTPEDNERKFLMFSDTSCNTAIRYISEFNDDVNISLNDTVNNSKAYIKSLSGLDAIVKIPDLNILLKDSMPFVINKAYISVSGNPYIYKGTNFTSSLVMQSSSGDNYIDDYNSNNYSKLSDNNYNIILTQELNNYITENIEIPGRFKLSPQITEKYKIPTGVELDNDSIKLVIIYHKLFQ